MFTLKELKFVKEVLVNSESQDDMTLALIAKTENEIQNAEECKDCLWEFYWDCGRGGEVRGMFKSTKEEVEKAINKEVYFGEILGKHSEIYGTLEECDIELVSDDPVIVNNSEESGYNPLCYLQYTCHVCGDSYPPR